MSYARLCVCAAAVAAVCVGAVVPVTAAHGAAGNSRRPVHHRVVHDVPGTRLIPGQFRTSAGPERVKLLKVDLSDRRLQFVPILAHGVVNGPRETVPSMVRRTHAVAAINGDFWHWGDPTSGPMHGIVSQSNVLKTPGYRTTSNFYITRDHRAHIGKVVYYTKFTWTAASGRTRHDFAFSINNLDDIYQHHLVMVTSAMSRVTIPDCTVIYTSHTPAGWTVNRVANHQLVLLQRKSGQRALVACGVTNLPDLRGRVLHWYPSQTVSGVTDLLSGGAEIVHEGRVYHDPFAQLWTNVINPMSFVCVSRSGWKVTLGVIDGRSRISHGVNYPMLTRYLTQTLGCWEAMTFDGGGSTTLWARGAVQNVPSDGSPRPVVDALLLFRR